MISHRLYLLFIPLFMLEQQKFSDYDFSSLIYLALFCLNIVAPGGSGIQRCWAPILAIIVNSLLMCIPWMGFRYMKTVWTSLVSSSFILFWLSLNTFICRIGDSVGPVNIRQCFSWATSFGTMVWIHRNQWRFFADFIGKRVIIPEFR